MAIKSKFTPTDLNEILSQYDIGEYVRFKPFERGTDQTNLLLTTTQRDVVLRYYEKRTLDYTKFEIELLQYLAKYSYPCAAPIASKEGRYVDTYREKPFALFEFLQGEHSDNLANYLQVAGAISKLHSLTINYRPTDGLTRPTYHAEYCWSCAKESAKRIKSQTEAQKRLAWVKAELGQLELPASLPKGVCHGDLNPSNFLYGQGKLSGVLDFDQSSYTWQLYDVGQLIYWWTWPNKGDIDFDRSRKLIEQYKNLRPMTDDEHQHLFDGLKLVILIGISWFLDEDEGYTNARRKVELLNTFSREGFYKNIFEDELASTTNSYVKRVRR